LYNKGCLKRNYKENGTFLISAELVVCKEQAPIVLKLKKAVIIKNKDATKEWIQEWRDLFPKGQNDNTGVSYKGDKTQCLKNMVKFRKENDYTKEEIFEITEKAINEAERVGYLYFPAAHYFIHKQGTGSKLSQLGELYREGGDDARRGQRTVI
jgi:hypothetical protein